MELVDRPDKLRSKTRPTFLEQGVLSYKSAIHLDFGGIYAVERSLFDPDRVGRTHHQRFDLSSRVHDRLPPSVYWSTHAVSR